MLKELDAQGIRWESTLQEHAASRLWRERSLITGNTFLSMGPLEGSLEVQLAALDARYSDPADSVLDQAVAAFERSYLLKALEKAEWNVAATARQLRLPLSTLKHRMGRLGLNDVTRRLRDG